MVCNYKICVVYVPAKDVYECSVWVHENCTSSPVKWRCIASVEVYSLEAHFAADDRLRQILRQLGAQRTAVPARHVRSHAEDTTAH